MSTSIEGKVAAIIDDTTLVLNVGSEQGVEEGMAFAIFAAHGEIEDPDSGQSLGRWEAVKARVVATHVQDRLCTVRAPVIGEAPVVGDTRPLSAMMVEHSVARAQEQWQRLEVRGTDVRGRPQNQPIAVGDGARSLAVAEEDVGKPAAEEDASKPATADDAGKSAAEEAAGKPATEDDAGKPTTADDANKSAD